MIQTLSKKHTTDKPAKDGPRIRLYPPNSAPASGYTVLYSIGEKEEDSVIYMFSSSSWSANEGHSGLPWELLRQGAVLTLTQE